MIRSDFWLAKLSAFNRDIAAEQTRPSSHPLNIDEGKMSPRKTLLVLGERARGLRGEGLLRGLFALHYKHKDF
jgi:hypothetical protein